MDRQTLLEVASRHGLQWIRQAIDNFNSRPGFDGQLPITFHDLPRPRLVTSEIPNYEPEPICYQMYDLHINELRDLDFKLAAIHPQYDEWVANYPISYREELATTLVNCALNFDLLKPATFHFLQIWRHHWHSRGVKIFNQPLHGFVTLTLRQMCHHRNRALIHAVDEHAYLNADTELDVMALRCFLEDDLFYELPNSRALPHFFMATYVETREWVRFTRLKNLFDRALPQTNMLMSAGELMCAIDTCFDSTPEVNPYQREISRQVQHRMLSNYREQYQAHFDNLVGRPENPEPTIPRGRLHSLFHYPIRYPEINKPQHIGDATCINNALSPHLQCAVNPAGECKECQHYEKRNDP